MYRFEFVRIRVEVPAEMEAIVTPAGELRATTAHVFFRPILLLLLLLLLQLLLAQLVGQRRENVGRESDRSTSFHHFFLHLHTYTFRIISD